MLGILIYMIVLTSASTSLLAAQEVPQVTVAEPNFSFPKTLAGELIEHDYLVTNHGSKPLRLLRANMTPPLQPVTMPAIIQPGKSVALRFRLDTSRVAGEFDGQIVLVTNDPNRPEVELAFQGEVVPLIEFDPLPAFFVSAQHGRQKTASIEIINHQQNPLEIQNADSNSSRFTIELVTVEPGKRFRLNLTVLADAPLGRSSETITLAISDPARPLLRIPANLIIRERVYAFPDLLDFGVLRPESLSGNLEQLSRVAQTLMVYQEGGKDFELSVHSDLPFLDFHEVRSDLGDRYQITVSVIPEELEPGKMEGSVVVSTNDPEFPQITVPVKAMVQGSW